MLTEQKRRVDNDPFQRENYNPFANGDQQNRISDIYKGNSMGQDKRNQSKLKAYSQRKSDLIKFSREVLSPYTINDQNVMLRRKPSERPPLAPLVQQVFD